MNRPSNKTNRSGKAALSLFLMATCCVGVSAKEVHSLDGQVLRPIPEKLSPEIKTEQAQPSAAPKKAEKTKLVTTKSVETNSDKSSSNKSATVNSSSAKASTAKSETAKSETVKFATTKTVTTRAGAPRRSPRQALVPPPPPDTPVMLADPSSMGMWGMPVEYMSKEALKDKAKELTIQYKDAQAELETKKRQQAELQERADSFDQLFTEGVVSRRELETSKRDAKETAAEVARLENKYAELKSLMDRVNKKLSAQAAKTSPKKLIH